MLSRLLASVRKTVTLSAAPERFRFTARGRDASIDTALRVAPDGRILGFGTAVPGEREGKREGEGKAQVMPVFASRGVDERALEVLCRRGLALALGPWGMVRPRVVVHGARRLPVPMEVLARALRAAGAASVEFAD